ncbi:MAG: 5-formyltetrahydrofolate cyclo-ligase [Ruminococcaceae bacterium]|nr:5-formyltetrahydrofolate cyclo-ligase [Oscillospiraceae bacterium]
MSIEKDKIREEYKKIRDEIPLGTQVLKSVAIWKYFFDLPEYENAKTVMIYSDIKSEVKTNVFAERLFSDGKRVVYPYTDKKEIVPYEVDSSARLMARAFGILEPNLRFVGDGYVKEIPKNEIDLVVVPGVVFDMFGDRLGYGGGYYDRFLKDFEGVKAGVSYSECVCYSLPDEETDVKMDMLITEAGCERFEQAE